MQLYLNLYYLRKKMKIEIALSKTKLTKLLIFSIIFFIAGFWLIISNPQISNPVFNHPITKAIGGYGGVIMGLWGIYFFSKKLIDKKPGLVISEEGIYDNASAFHFGLIPWTDISEIYEGIVEVPMAAKQRFVTIGLTDPDKYISRETNVLKRKLLMANAKSYGSPIHISTNGLNMDHNELMNLTDEYFKKFKHNS
jgi:hypothetical protein